MVTANKSYQYYGGAVIVKYEVFCLSTDTKPTTDIPNGASLTEIDTGNFYLFNGDTSAWVFQCSLQG
jgi:hypothetical protein